MARNGSHFIVSGSVVRAAHFALLAALLAVTLPGVAQASPPCGLNTFKGVYGLVAHGLIIDEPPIPSIFNGPVARVGRAESDGNGHLTLNQVASYSGVPSNETADGTYTVTPDCIITFFINAPPPVGFLVTFQGAISADGSFSTFAQLDPGGSTILANSRRAQPTCTFDDLKGSYDLEIKGNIMPHAVIPLPPPYGTITVGNDLIAGDFAAAGQVIFEPPRGLDLVNGKPGTVYGYTNSSFNGHVDVENWSGVYSVNRDCTVSVSYSANAGAAGVFDFQWWAVLTGQGRDLRIMQMPLTLGPVFGDAYRSK